MSREGEGDGSGRRLEKQGRIASALLPLRSVGPLAAGLLIISTIALVLISFFNYLLFHSLIETIASIIAFSLFIIAWNSRRYHTNNFLVLYGAANFFIALLGILHMLAYQGMGVFPGATADLPTQLWLVTRYTEAIALFSAALLMKRSIPTGVVFAAFGTFAFVSLAAIYLGVFPHAFIPGSGLTTFKVVSEYVVCTLIALAMIILYRNRSMFERDIFVLIMWSLALAIIAELLFTLYTDVFGVLNLLGHITILVSFFLIFMAIVRTGIERPYDLVFRDLKVSESSLRVERDFAEGIISNAPAIIMLVGPDGRIRRINPYMEEVSLWKSADVVGRLWTEALAPECERGVCADKVAEAIASVTGISFYGHIHAKSGQEMEIQWRLKAVGGSEGTKSVVLFLGHDVTEERRLERELSRRAEELSRSNEALQSFAYVASHDLQEPIRMVISYVSLLERRYGNKLDDSAKEYIRHAVDGGMRMRELISDLLDYSRVESKGKQFVPVDLNKVVAETLDLMKTAIAESKAEITVADLPTVYADRTQMVQLFQNLISNAIKFRGSSNPRVTITSSDDGKEWTIAVSDNGIGMKSSDLDRIFQMFQRLHTREEYPGTGIGLAIAKKIVERHGGRIWVESEEVKGSTFYFTLPKEPTL